MDSETEMSSKDWIDLAAKCFSNAEDAASDGDDESEAYFFRKSEVGALLAIAMHLQERAAD